MLPSRNGARGIGRGKVLTESDYDFLAVSIPDRDAWRLVPPGELMNTAMAEFYPHNPKSKGRYEKYRSALAFDYFAVLEGEATFFRPVLVVENPKTVLLAVLPVSFILLLPVLVPPRFKTILLAVLVVCF